MFFMPIYTSSSYNKYSKSELFGLRPFPIFWTVRSP